MHRSLRAKCETEHQCGPDNAIRKCCKNHHMSPDRNVLGSDQKWHGIRLAKKVFMLGANISMIQRPQPIRWILLLPINLLFLTGVTMEMLDDTGNVESSVSISRFWTSSSGIIFMAGNCNASKDRFITMGVDLMPFLSSVHLNLHHLTSSSFV